MLRVLKARMIESNVTEGDLAKLIRRSERCVKEKIAGKSPFSFPDTVLIRDTHFKQMPLEELFRDTG